MYRVYHSLGYVCICLKGCLSLLNLLRNVCLEFSLILLVGMLLNLGSPIGPSVFYFWLQNQVSEL
jgi:hypothetical protein